MTSTVSIRDPDQGTPQLRRRRAWWLVALGVLVPGTAQLLAGSRRLGRFGVGSTLVFWAVSLVALLIYALWRPAFLFVVTNYWALWVIQLALLFYAVLWIVLAVDTLRLVRLVRLPGATRLAVATVAIAAMVASVGGVGYGAIVAGSARSLIDTVFGGGQMEPPVDGRYNFLLLGGDAGPDRLGLRPDSISVVSVDAATGAATIIGIPRNLEQATFSERSPLFEPFPNGYDCGDDCLISYLYTYGNEHPDLYPEASAGGSDPGIEAMRDAAEGVTGLELQYFVLIDMQGFSDLIDALGGIDITVESAVTLGRNGDDPIGTIAAGQQHMDGATALWYARSRYNTTDYARMQRQRDVQAAIIAQFEPANVLTKFQTVADAGSQVVKTDIPQGMLAGFVELASKTRALPVVTVELIPENSIVTAHPDYERIRTLIDEALAASSPSPSPPS